MSVLADHRAAIAAKLAGVNDIGNVHAYERYNRSEARFAEQYLFTPEGGDRQLRGWTIRRIRTSERTVSTGTVSNLHTWQIRGYWALNDEAESELAFDEAIEAFREAVRDDPTLGGAADQNSMGDDDDGVQVLDSGPVMFCGVLCHSAVLQLKTWSLL